jgi:hypothetical protein
MRHSTLLKRRGPGLGWAADHHAIIIAHLESLRTKRIVS